MINVSFKERIVIPATGRSILFITFRNSIMPSNLLNYTRCVILRVKRSRSNEKRVRSDPPQF